MGSFDHITFDERYNFRFTKSKIKLIDEALGSKKWNREFQTKDLTLWLDNYHVDASGKLWLKDDKGGRRRRVYISQTITCSTYITCDQLSHDLYIEHTIKFVKGVARATKTNDIKKSSNETRISNHNNFEKNRKKWDARRKSKLYKIYKYAYKQPVSFMLIGIAETFKWLYQTTYRIKRVMLFFG
jgi:hypothetical protein